MKIFEKDFYCWFGGGGFSICPYQLAFGISLRYWPCLFAPAFRIYIGPFKVWGYISLKFWIPTEKERQEIK